MSKAKLPSAFSAAGRNLYLSNCQAASYKRLIIMCTSVLTQLRNFSTKTLRAATFGKNVLFVITPVCVTPRSITKNFLGHIQVKSQMVSLR